MHVGHIGKKMIVTNFQKKQLNFSLEEWKAYSNMTKGKH